MRLLGLSAADGLVVLAEQPSASDVPVLLLIDTTGCDCDEEVEDEGDSKRNQGEAKVVLAHAQHLVDAGLSPAQIGVITPYNGQVNHAGLTSPIPHPTSRVLQVS